MAIARRPHVGDAVENAIAWLRTNKPRGRAFLVVERRIPAIALQIGRRVDEKDVRAVRRRDFDRRRTRLPQRRIVGRGHVRPRDPVGAIGIIGAAARWRRDIMALRGRDAGQSGAAELVDGEGAADANQRQDEDQIEETASTHGSRR